MPAIDLSLKNLAAVVTGCRHGLESLTDSPYSLLKGFPSGACGVASEIVGRVLNESFSCCANYVCGRTHPSCGEDQSHAWIEVEGFLIDVTHDQFKDTGLSGWVFSGVPAWHRSFQYRDARKGFCMPFGWPCYPFDGYNAARTAAQKALDVLLRE